MNASGSEAWLGSVSSHRDRERERILHTAAVVLAEHGYGGLTMSALAEAAGISRQTLYKYFADTDSVVTGLALAANDGIAALAEQTAEADSPAAGLTILIEAILGAGASGHPSPLVLAATAPPESRADVRTHQQAAEAIVVGLIERGQADGSFRDDLDPQLDGRILFRSILGVHDLAAEPGPGGAALAEHTVRDLLRIVERQPGRG